MATARKAPAGVRVTRSGESTAASKPATASAAVKKPAPAKAAKSSKGAAAALVTEQVKTSKKPANAKPTSAASLKSSKPAKPTKPTKLVKPAAEKPAAADAKASAKAEAMASGKTSKPKKQKLVRDSFTMPESEYALLGEVKKACIANGFAVKKSELLRVGVALIRTLDPSSLKTWIASLPPLKPGRPRKEKPAA